MFDALQKAEHLIEQFGGHSIAAGLKLKIENVPKLKEHLEKLVAEQLTEVDLLQKINIDAQACLTDVTKKFMSDMQHLQPFGNENREPVFHIKGVTLMQKPLLLKDAHVKCTIFADGIIKPLIFFNRPNLFPLLVQQGDKPFDVVATVTENHWNGRVNIELLGVDIAFGLTPTISYNTLVNGLGLGPGIYDLVLNLAVPKALANTDIATTTIEIIPEPATICLLGLGGFALLRRTKRG